MKIAVIVHTTDAETAWNAFRFGVYGLKQGDEVGAFLMAKGVECEKLDTEKFKVTEQMRAFLEAGGKIMACGTCLKIRNQPESAMCPLSTMKDMYDLVRGADRVLTF